MATWLKGEFEEEWIYVYVWLSPFADSFPETITLLIGYTPIYKKKKMQHIYFNTMEYYSAIKMNKIMPFTTTWMNLEITILSEISQIKTNIIRYCLHVESKKKK